MLRRVVGTRGLPAGNEGKRLSAAGHLIRYFYTGEGYRGMKFARVKTERFRKKSIMNKNKLIGILALLAVCNITFAQKVFSVEYPNQADVKVFVVKYESQCDLKVFKVEYENQAGENDGKWFFTEYENQAKKKIYFVEYENQADLKIYFVEYESQAGWKSKKKMHLMY